MTEHPLRGRLERVLLHHLEGHKGVGSLRDSTPLYGRGVGLDSLDVVALIVKIEEEFDIFFEAEEVAEGIATFGTLMRMIEHKVCANGADGHR